MAESGSKKAMWLAMGGLVAVPLIAIIIFVSMDEPKRRSRGNDDDDPMMPVVEGELDAEAPRRVVRRAPPEATQAPEDTDDPPTDEPETPEDPRVAQLIDNAFRVESSDPALSRKLLRDALDIDPQNEVALESLAMKMLLDEQHVDAKDLAKRCTEVNNGNAGCHSINAQVVQKIPELPKLVEGVTKCLEDQPDNPDCLHGMASYNLLERKLEDAQVYADRLTKAAPNSDLAPFVRGRVAGAGGNYRAARTHYDTACSRGNQMACFRAEALRKEGW